MKKLLLLSSTLFFLFPYAVSASWSVGGSGGEVYEIGRGDLNALYPNETRSVEQVLPPGLTGSISSIYWQGTNAGTLIPCYLRKDNSALIQVSSATTSNPYIQKCDFSSAGLSFVSTSTYKFGVAFFMSGTIFGSDVSENYGSSTCTYVRNLSAESSCDSIQALRISSDFLYSPDSDYSTHIISLKPENGSTTGNVVNFGLEYWISIEDMDLYNEVTVVLRNIDQNVLLLGAFSPSDILLYEGVITTAGLHTYATSTFLGDGNYRLEAWLTASDFWSWSELNISQSTQFTVNQGTFIGNISQNSYASYGALLASTTATSTLALSKSCKPFSGEFDTVNCLAFLFIPDAYLAQQSIENFRSEVLTRFPLGYVTDFISILSTGTSTTVTLVDLQVPGILPGGGKTMTLTIDEHSLDMLLNATSSVFATTKQNDSRTFREITEEYWLIVLGVLTLLYILRRILGDAVIPELRSFGEQEPLYASAETMRRARKQNTRGSVYSSRGWDK